MENDKVNNLQIYPIRIKDNFEESMRDKYTSLQMSFLELCKAYDLSWFRTKFNVAVQNPKGVKTFRLHFWEKNGQFSACFIIHENFLFPKYYLTHSIRNCW